MEAVVAQQQNELRSFVKDHGNHVMGEVTISQIIGGMRGLPGMLYETSKLHPTKGINYRGHDLFKIREVAPKTVPGGQPIPEGVLWLLLTGEFPSESEINELKEDIYKRGELTA